jgi:hypothetical protein
MAEYGLILDCARTWFPVSCIELGRRGFLAEDDRNTRYVSVLVLPNLRFPRTTWLLSVPVHDSILPNSRPVDPG